MAGQLTEHVGSLAYFVECVGLGEVFDVEPDCVGLAGVPHSEVVPQSVALGVGVRPDV